MNSLLQSTKELFPELTFCDIITKTDQQDLSRALAAYDKCTAVQHWVSWFCESEDSISYLRVNLLDTSQLYFKRLSSDHYLLIYNEAISAIQIISYLEAIDTSTLKAPQVPQVPESIEAPQDSQEEADEKMQAAIRIQKMIIPRTNEIQKQFKEFFVVHEQQDHVGGDFYWFHHSGSITMLALIDCTGHSLEGAMASMACNSLMNQAVGSTESTDPVVILHEFYDLLQKYNDASGVRQGYGIGAEVGLFSFDSKRNEFKFASTGICSFVKRGNEIEQLRVRRLMDYSKFSEKVTSSTYSMEGIDCIYAFTDGLPDQFNAQDSKKLGRRGVMEMIRNEDQFGADYYNYQIAKWKGDNMQYDDITILGVAL